MQYYILKYTSLTLRCGCQTRFTEHIKHKSCLFTFKTLVLYAVRYTVHLFGCDGVAYVNSLDVVLATFMCNSLFLIQRCNGFILGFIVGCAAVVLLNKVIYMYIDNSYRHAGE